MPSREKSQLQSHLVDVSAWNNNNNNHDNASNLKQLPS